MGKGIFKKLRSGLEGVAAKVADIRKKGPALKYRIDDGIKSAFAMFFFQYPSLLSFHQQMKRKQNSNNVKKILGETSIPCDNKIRGLLDMVPPSNLSKVFLNNVKVLEEEGKIEDFRVLDGGVLVAADGTEYHSSKEIHCERCLHQEKNGVITYHHNMVAVTIVKPGESAIIPLMPEMIENKDGTAKQDCEINASKRWLESHAEEYAWLKPTLLGDDLYSNYPMCKTILDKGMSFIFTCKPSSHKWLTETVENSYLEEYVETKWNASGKQHLIHKYSWLQAVEIRDNPETLPVNYMALEVRIKETDAITYRNSWITNKAITKDNIVHLVSCARARWKIENENNNVLKNHGYHLEHNFGHGKQYASEIFCLLNLLSFQFHTVLDLCDELYKNLRISAGRRDEFFNILRSALRFVSHESWEAFLSFALADDADLPGG